MSESSQRNRVDVIVEGYAEDDRATGTVSLVRTSEGRSILVDAGDPWNGEELVEKLRGRGVETDQITDVVITHGHIDHCGNVGSFRRARFFMDCDWAVGGRYGQREDPHSLSASVRIEKRTGHTASDLIVVVEQEERGGTIVVAGDLFEDGDDEERWRGNSQYEEEQGRSREYVRQIASWIVPGHGDIFKVEKR